MPHPKKITMQSKINIKKNNFKTESKTNGKSSTIPFLF